MDVRPDSRQTALISLFCAITCRLVRVISRSLPSVDVITAHPNVPGFHNVTVHVAASAAEYLWNAQTSVPSVVARGATWADHLLKVGVGGDARPDIAEIDALILNMGIPSLNEAVGGVLARVTIPLHGEVVDVLKRVAELVPGFNDEVKLATAFNWCVELERHGVDLTQRGIGTLVEWNDPRLHGEGATQRAPARNLTTKGFSAGDESRLLTGRRSPVLGY